MLCDIIRWDYVMEYSREINVLLGGQKLSPSSVIEDPKTVLKVCVFMSLY